VIKRTLRKDFPEQNAIEAIRPGLSADEVPKKMREIVGIAGNIKHRSLKNDDTPGCLPRAQIPFNIMTGRHWHFESGEPYLPFAASWRVDAYSRYPSRRQSSRSLARRVQRASFRFCRHRRC
jgi:hypothetical protein